MSNASSSRPIPSQPDPPVVGRVTYHSIELSWHTPPLNSQDDGCASGGETNPQHDLLYCIQEENTEKKRGFVTVYEGTDLHNVFDGLSSSTEYHYRLRCSNDYGHGPWSPVVVVSTTRHAVTSEHMHKAIQRNDVDTVRKILEDNPSYLNIPDIYGASPLMAACRKGRKKVVDLLLAMGADTEYHNTAGKTCIMEACYHGYNDCINLLCSAGASLLTEDSSGMSALHWAVDGGNCETVELILSEGVPVDIIGEQNISHWTPLLKLAATNGSISVARVLIRHKADINRKDKDGQTPLMLACISGNVELVEVLLHYEANLNITTKHGKTALDFAIASGKENIVELLKKALIEI